MQHFHSSFRPSGHILIASICIVLMAAPGCAVVKKLVGADIDPEQFAKAREARTMQLRRESAEKLLTRLHSGEPLDRADICITLRDAFLNKVAHQYVGATGKLDASTSYTVTETAVATHFGSAMATLSLTAHNDSWNVDVDLAMDCFISIAMQDGKLVMALEPYNISPVVRAGGILSATEEIIGNIIKIKLANMRNDFPPMTIPVELSNSAPIQSVYMEIHQVVNAKVESPGRNLQYALNVREVQFMEGAVYVSVNLSSVGVKK